MTELVATAQKTIESVQSFLDEELEDPNTDRTGSTRWIYRIPINYDIAQYPRIHIQEISNIHEPQSIGTTRRYMETRVQLTVYNHVDGKFDVDNDGEFENAYTVINHLIGRVTQLINSNQARWRQVEDCHIYNVITQNDERHETQREDVIARRLEFIIRRRQK